MLEKEIKILEIDQEKLIADLKSLGGIETFNGVIHDVYYDFPSDSKKDKMHANNRMFRIRKKGEEHIYTIKNRRFDVEENEAVIAKDEHETPITDVENFKQVLEKYGMEQTREKLKHRISYNINGSEFDIDKYEGMPAFLEIEETSEENINAWIKKLGLENHEILLGGSKKLFKHYGLEYKYLK